MKRVLFVCVLCAVCSSAFAETVSVEYVERNGHFYKRTMVVSESRALSEAEVDASETKMRADLARLWNLKNAGITDAQALLLISVMGVGPVNTGKTYNDTLDARIEETQMMIDAIDLATAHGANPK